MDKVQVSIIIPAYNVENYIEECIDSVLKQDLKNYEIIVVNDGSTDNTGKILEKYNNLGNIKIMFQENKGLSGARNTGLRNADGDYILFLDSDDFIEKDSLRKILNYIKKKDLDILAFNYFVYYNKNIFFIEKRSIIEGTIPGIEYLKNNLLKKSYPMSWLNMYNRKFLLTNNLFFKEGILHEDLEFNIRLLKKVQKMEYLDMPIIYYRQREGSITKSRKNRRYSYIKILETYLKEIEDIEDNQLLQLLYNYMGYISKNIIIECLQEIDVSFLKENKQMLKNILLKTKKIKYKILLVILII